MVCVGRNRTSHGVIETRLTCPSACVYVCLCVLLERTKRVRLPTHTRIHTETHTRISNTHKDTHTQTHTQTHTHTQRERERERERETVVHDPLGS